MYLSCIKATNFRTFGQGEESLDLKFHPGLNVLVGENDSGKSAIMDAIRYVLGTTSQEYIRFQETDFHQSSPGETGKATQFFITLKFESITVEEGSGLVEHLTQENGKDVLYITLLAELAKAKNGSWLIKNVKRRSGKDGDGLEVDGETRASLCCTFLKPLRDAENELASGRNSRLSQILLSHSDLEPHKERLLDILNAAERELAAAQYLNDTSVSINDNYLSEVSLEHSGLQSRIALVGMNLDGQQRLKQLFEKLELFLSHTRGQELRTRHGLGANNLLFIAAELLLLKNNCHESNPLLLIEEPEAHLHPQAQMQLLDFLLKETSDSHDQTNTGRVANDEDHAEQPIKPQVIITTHSPNLASKLPVENLTLVIDGKPYGLGKGETNLSDPDYKFLKKFLDVTKANMFFARGIIIVEGDAENILVPTIARLINMPLEKYGVSIVKVGHVGFFRYARIYQRAVAAESLVPIHVACIADRDLRPDLIGHDGEITEVEYQYVKKTAGNANTFEGYYSTAVALNDFCARRKVNDGQNVKTFLSPKWTLEYDLAFGREDTGRSLCLETYQAIQLACKSHNAENRTSPTVLSEAEVHDVKAQAETTYNSWESSGFDRTKKAAIAYKPVFERNCSKTEVAYFLAQILEEKYKTSSQDLENNLPMYLVNAIKYGCTGQRTPDANPQDQLQNAQR